MLSVHGTVSLILSAVALFLGADRQMSNTSLGHEANFKGGYGIGSFSYEGPAVVIIFAVVLVTVYFVVKVVYGCQRTTVNSATQLDNAGDITLAGDDFSDSETTNTVTGTNRQGGKIQLTGSTAQPNTKNKKKK